MADAVKLHPGDSVAVVLRDMSAGETLSVDGQTITIRESIPYGHKVAVRAMRPHQPVIKYGDPIGHAIDVVAVGQWVHTHNVRTNLDGTLEYRYERVLPPSPAPLPSDWSFSGFRRADGSVGVRNEIWILPTVNCVNQIGTLIAQRASKMLGTEEWGDGIDGVYSFTHPYGCSQLGEDHRNTQRILAGLARHPNAAGVLVLSLGCEDNNLADFQPILGDYDPQRMVFLTAQEVEDEIDEGVSLVMQLARRYADAEREPLPLSAMKIGLKCGGSDGFSGITANPLVGRVSDWVTGAGGTTVLTEVPEMFGAEHLLMNRAVDEAVFHKIVSLINDFKQYFLDHDQPVDENPSKGNMTGGITTLEDKSLGCTQKGGTSFVMDVVDYGDPVSTPGLNLLSSPGNDGIAATALAAAGCQLVLFTTGRGTPFGTCVPTVKIATNPRLYNRKQSWMDFNAGIVLEGETLDFAARQFMDYLMETASGRIAAKNEVLGFRELVIYKSGVTV